MQVGSIVYKGISYTKEGTTVSTKPNPQEGSGGWGGNLAGADMSGGAAHPPPPLSLSIAKLNFSVLCLVLLSLLVKHKIIVIKRQMWKMAKGGNIPIFNRTGGIFLGSGLKQLEWDHCHQSWPEAMVCYPVNPFPSRQPPPHHPLSHRQRVTAWGHGTARPDILTLPCEKSQLSPCKSGVWGVPPVLLCTTAICRAGTEQRTGGKGKQRKKERKKRNS